MGLCDRVTGLVPKPTGSQPTTVRRPVNKPIGDSHPHSRVRINPDAWNLTPEASHSSAQADGLSF
jgi:hypothetical protein